MENLVQANLNIRQDALIKKYGSKTNEMEVDTLNFRSLKVTQDIGKMVFYKEKVC